MPRFFVEEMIDAAAGAISIVNDDYHHIRDVLRLKAGDLITVCDGMRTDYKCRISRIDEQAVVADIVSATANQAEPPYRVVLYQGLAKGDRMEFVVQKAVELGVSRIVPVVCSRSVVKISEKDRSKKIFRWQRIAESAAKQSGRGMIPEISLPLSLSLAASEMARADIVLFPWENERQLDVRQYLQAYLEKPLPAKPEIAVIIGPEGGFSAGEASLLQQAGIQPLSLGKRILRTETAGMAVLAMLTYQFADF